MANMAKKFSLNDWAGEYGLTAPTVDALTEEKLVELEVLTELTKDDVLGSSTLSQLSLGERLILRHALAGLCTGVTQEAPPTEPGTIPNQTWRLTAIFVRNYDSLKWRATAWLSCLVAWGWQNRPLSNLQVSLNQKVQNLRPNHPRPLLLNSCGWPITRN